MSFSPAVSVTATKAIRLEIRAWRLHQRTESSLTQLAEAINSIVRGWVTYYGRFYRSRLYPSLRNINEYLVRWAMRKYKRLRNRATVARAWLAVIAARQPRLFRHWQLGLLP